VWGPLDRLGGDAEKEADVIFTAVVLGFGLTRAIQEQPFSFDMQPVDDPGAAEKDLSKLRAAVAGMTRLLQRSGVDKAERYISSDLTPGYKGMDSNLITGRAGGEHLTPEQRRRPLLDEQAANMGRWEHNSSQPGAEQFGGQYHGVGAYTGMIDDPVGSHTLIQPTLRRVINDPSRWNPRPDALWGLIGTNNAGGETGVNLNEDPNIGMGPLRQHQGVVQYIHGMSWAMREAIRWGPWCTAYEMAVGSKTRKLASCFACTTYMWASGFPASSTHLGRGESWGVLPDGTLGAGEDHTFSDESEGASEQAIARSMNIRWHTQIYHFLRQGSRLLEGHRLAMSPGHRTAADLLAQRVERPGADGLVNGGNLFLDALTFHKNDTDRLLATLGTP
jgi:hypothetical protein